jgi:muconolactone delta-isomerase
MEENNVEEEAKVNPSLQSEILKNLKIENEEKMMKQNLKTLHNQRKLWRLEGRNVLC